MRQLVIIVMKSDVDLNQVNNYLETVGIENKIITEQMNIEWLNDINTNPKSHHKHLKPKDRNLTLEELKEYIPLFTTVGQMNFDVAFGRTTDEEANNYAKFILDYKDHIEYIKDGKEFIKRFKLTKDQINVIKLLNKNPEEPKKLPKDQQNIHNFQGGQLLCKSWSKEPFWIIYGKVDSPKFLKDKIYEDDLYNNFYKDNKGYVYMLVPLMPLNNNQVEFVNRVYQEAYELGLRENINLFAPAVYGLDLDSYNEITNQFKVWYTVEEIKEKFQQQFEITNNLFPYNNPRGIIWNDRKKMFKPCGTSTPTIMQQAKCSLLTCLLRSMDSNVAADMMSKLLNKKFIPFEFA